MSSTNEELPPKPRVSPLDFRNTDLVSRLLAATPPYLYNMPLVPNSYFFSEMLRSLVQAKSDASNRTSLNMHHRRSRKRSWTQAKNDCYKTSPKPTEQNKDWPPKFQEKPMEVPLELTTNKISSINDNLNPAEDTKATIKQNLENTKHEIPQNSNLAPMMYSNPTPSSTQQNGNLIMPPPPVWYPSLYPSPYGIDPLHFFIDLRVSSHIYDRKNQKDIPSVSSSHIPPRGQITPDVTEEQQQQENPTNFHGLTAQNNNFKQTRHASAFTVPIPGIMKTVPMNLSSDKPAERTETKTTKFDVKSMGFDKSYSKTSTNYIMANVGNIYKTLTEQQSTQCNDVQEIQVDEPVTDNNSKEEEEEPEKTVYEDSDEQKRKKVKDLRALIGLELVVDYMNHTKPRQAQENFDDSSVDADSTASSAVEVVSVEGSSPDVLTY